MRAIRRSPVLMKLLPPGSKREAWLRLAWERLQRLRQLSPLELAARAGRHLPPPLSRPLAGLYRRYRRWRVARLRRQMQAIIAAQAAQAGGEPRIIVFPPGLDWRTQLFQRPQQLALAFARQGALVFYTQPKVRRGEPAFQEIAPRLILCNAPVDIFWMLPSPLVYLLTWNRQYAGLFDRPRLIYDYVDEIETFYGDHARMRRDHERLVVEAALMIATAERLHQQVLPLRPDALLCPNGVDYPLFHLDPLPAPPEDLLPILAEGKPLIGYYGALARWFDYDLLAALARLRPDLNFVLVGPDYDNTLEPAGILAASNIHWLGVKPYGEIPACLHAFDVAIIPFRLNEITHSTSPLKLFEYMAGGKPVVITPMHESLRTPGVIAAATPDEFSAGLDRALALRADPAYLALIDGVARANTWDARARQILDALAG